MMTEANWGQGFPMLINRTRTSEHQNQSQNGEPSFSMHKEHATVMGRVQGFTFGCVAIQMRIPQDAQREYNKATI